MIGTSKNDNSSKQPLLNLDNSLTVNVVITVCYCYSSLSRICYFWMSQICYITCHAVRIANSSNPPKYRAFSVWLKGVLILFRNLHLGWPFLQCIVILKITRCVISETRWFLIGLNAKHKTFPDDVVNFSRYSGWLFMDFVDCLFYKQFSLLIGIWFRWLRTDSAQWGSRTPSVWTHRFQRTKQIIDCRLTAPVWFLVWPRKRCHICGCHSGQTDEIFIQAENDRHKLTKALTTEGGLRKVSFLVLG